MMALQGFGEQLALGALTTLKAAALSLILGLSLGLCGALAKQSRLSVLRSVAACYTAVIRGVPELLVILIFYFGGTVALTATFGHYVEVNALSAGVAALTIVFGAYATETFRAALLAIPKGQLEAAQTLGLSKALTFRLVVLPQIWRYALPGLGNLWLTLLKDTSLVSVVGLDDLMRKATIAAGVTHDPLTFYLAAAMTYLSFTSVSLYGQTHLERRASRGFHVSDGARS